MLFDIIKNNWLVTIVVAFALCLSVSFHYSNKWANRKKFEEIKKRCKLYDSITFEDWSDAPKYKRDELIDGCDWFRLKDKEDKKI